MTLKKTPPLYWLWLITLILVMQSSVVFAAPKRAPEVAKVVKKKVVHRKVVPSVRKAPVKKNTKTASAFDNSHRQSLSPAHPQKLKTRADQLPHAVTTAQPDGLGLKSNAVMVVDQNTQEVLFNKNGTAVLPIASLTKLMTGLVITDAGLSMDERVTITEDDVDTLKGSSSRLVVGTNLSRGELMHLALMSSENRAAHALGRTFPGGLNAFVESMNAKAKLLGMGDTKYVDPTGLSPSNQSSAKDLAILAAEAYHRPIIRDLSTSVGYEVDTGRRTIQYRNTNRLVSNPNWDIGLQKTGYIAEAGRCLVMQAKVAGREVIMVFLDSAGKLTRLADAERVRRWVESKS